MEAPLNYYLRKRSYDLFIKQDSEERRRIDSSIIKIISNLTSHFGDSVDRSIVFGSYTRDTILPRNYDPNSDIDILVQFNTEKYKKLNPESYRNQLKRFAESKYPNSLSQKDHPSIVLELNHIKFDLVPAVFDIGFFYNSLEIPDKNGSWMETEPDKFNEVLTQANKNYDSIVKPIARLLKGWNAAQDYPYASYDLEQHIADMNFTKDNYQSGFLFAITKLADDNLPERSKKKLESLKKKGEKIEEYLEKDRIEEAKRLVNQLIPISI